jgi:uncharacterized protein YlzI (FlbEa/FlbD family)
MAKFIIITETGPLHRRLAINIETIEYMLERPIGTEIVTSANHTKYVVQESLDDIMQVIYNPIASKTSPTMEVKNDETELETGDKGLVE